MSLKPSSPFLAGFCHSSLVPLFLSAPASVLDWPEGQRRLSGVRVVCGHLTLTVCVILLQDVSKKQ